MPSVTASVARIVLRSLPLYNGKGRIIDRTGLRRLAFAEDVLDVTTADGFSMRVLPNDLIGRHLFLTGRFDRCVVDALVSRAKPGAVLWDIGANVGYVSCAFLERVPDSRVIAVEPLGDVAALLRDNLRHVGGDRARVIQAAVSERAGESLLVRTPGNLGRSHVSDSGDGERVELITPGELLSRSEGRVDLIKIDVEGHERAVIAGLGPILRSARPEAVVFEHHTSGAIDPAIERVFSDAGYEILRIFRRWSGWRLARWSGKVPGYSPSSDFVGVPRP
jgi:FkbM family methyltransferase